MTLSIADDYKLFDNTQTVTHTRVRANRVGADQTDSVTYALRHQVSEREAALSGGVYTTQDVTWNLPAAQAAYDPKPGDTITESGGTVWTILAVDKATFGIRWRCTSRDLVVANDLYDTVGIWSLTGVDDGSGGQKDAFLPKNLGLAARVQEVSGTQTEDLGQRYIKKTYQVFLATSVEVIQGDQVRIELSDNYPTGTVLEIVGYQDPDRLDGLMTLNCE